MIRNYEDRSYAEGIKGAVEEANSFEHLASSRSLRGNKKLQLGRKKELRNQAKLQYQAIQNKGVRHSLEFHRNSANVGIASLKEKLRKNANVKKWKGRREKQFGNHVRGNSFSNPEEYSKPNTRYVVKNTHFPKNTSEDKGR